MFRLPSLVPYRNLPTILCTTSIIGTSVVIKKDGYWWYWGLQELIGPYQSYERAVEKYQEYCAYVIDAPGCHHP